MSDPARYNRATSIAATTDNEALLRLALWLADVSAEAALLAAPPAAGAIPGPAAPRCTEEAAGPPAGSSAS